jgi:RHS repeat-associated protein
VQKTVGGQVTRYVYAGGPAPVAEINVTAGTTKDFIQTNGRTWGVMDATSNTYFHHDAIGSVVALSNNSGQVTDTYEYEPFGKVLDHQGTSTNDYQFVGGYGVRKLNDTLDTMGVRQYSEKVGRFTTQDPLGLMIGLNFYRYVSNEPLNAIDSDGLKESNVVSPMPPLHPIPPGNPPTTIGPDPNPPVKPTNNWSVTGGENRGSRCLVADCLYHCQYDVNGNILYRDYAAACGFSWRSMCEFFGRLEWGPH